MKVLRVIGCLVVIAVHLLGLCVGTGMIAYGNELELPDKNLIVSSYLPNDEWEDNVGDEYVGGDAYNYQMEASLKAGYMSGMMTVKAIMMAGGALIDVLVLISLAVNLILKPILKRNSDGEKTNDLLYSLMYLHEEVLEKLNKENRSQ